AQWNNFGLGTKVTVLPR
uniref:Uncharacterized protein n=2 Tax=Dasyuridae TaxID=9277 RepID=A0A7N4V0M8_SARHA